MGPPVIAAGKVYWLSTVYAMAFTSPFTTLLERPETTMLESWDLATGSPSGWVRRRRRPPGWSPTEAVWR